MALTPDQVAALDVRAREVGEQIGRRLRFMVAPNPEFIGLVAGEEQVVVGGLNRLSDLAAHEVDFTLDDLAAGRRQIIDDEDGDPTCSDARAANTTPRTPPFGNERGLRWRVFRQRKVGHGGLHRRGRRARTQLQQ
ncbi:hypothetical protein ACF044_02140 [Microbacterium sp. NPDC016588]